MKRLLAILVLVATFLAPVNASAIDMEPHHVVVAVNEYYQDLYELTGQTYRKPTVRLLEDGAVYDGECGRVTGGMGFYAFYCPPDETIVMDMPVLNLKSAVLGDVMFALVLAHEWAHHAQNLSDLQRSVNAGTKANITSPSPIEAELQADCLAGVLVAHLDGLDEIESSDVVEAILVAREYGDDNSSLPGITSPRTSGQAHGTGDERADAVMRGYNDGLVGCMTINPVGI